MPYIQKQSKSNDKENKQLEINNYSKKKLSNSISKFPSKISKKVSFQKTLEILC